MGFRSKRRAKQVPDLVERLEAVRTMMAAQGASGKLDQRQMEALDKLGPDYDALIDKGNAYLAEYRAEGDISDPDLGDWISRADVFVLMGFDSVRKAQAKMRA